MFDLRQGAEATRTIRAHRAFIAFVVCIATLCGGATTASASSLPEWQSEYAWPAGHGYNGWFRADIGPNLDDYGTSRSLGGTPGLWTWLIGDVEYRPGSVSWVYEAPGTTRIASARLDLNFRNKLLAHHCLTLQLVDDSGAIDSTSNCSPPDDVENLSPYVLSLADFSDSPTAKRLLFTIEMPACNNPDDTPCSKWIPSLDPLVNGAMARLNSVEMVLVDDDSPVPTASGALYDLRDNFVNGRLDIGVNIAAADAGSGVRRAALEHAGPGDWIGANAPCDPAHHTETLVARICPSTWAADLTAPVTALVEGKHWFNGVAHDVANNIGRTSPWNVSVDRTGPSTPGSFGVDFDEESLDAEVNWMDSIDPPLADGNASSTLDYYEVRYRRGTADQIDAAWWSLWQQEDSSDVTLTGSYIGEIIAVQVVAIDSVGNRSVVGEAQVTVAVSEKCDPLTGEDTVGPRLHLGSLPDGTIIDSFTFATPKTQSELMAGIPLAATLLTAVERTYAAPGDRYTGSIRFDKSWAWAENFEVYNDYVLKQIDSLRDSAINERRGASIREQAHYTKQIAALNARESAYLAAGGPKFRSFAIVHDPAAASQISANFAGAIQDEQLGIENEDCAGFANSVVQAADSSTSKSMRVGGKASVAGDRVQAASAVNGRHEIDVRPLSYHPPAVKVETESGWKPTCPRNRNCGTWNWVAVQYKWQSRANYKYWYGCWRKAHTVDRPRRRCRVRFFNEDQQIGDVLYAEDMIRGVEVALDMDVDGAGGPYGKPTWRVPAWDNTDDSNNGDGPDLWSTNQPCPYAEDYNKPWEPDKVHGRYGLTIGSGCRPTKPTELYWWSHLTVPNDNSDNVRPSVSPVHKAHQGHDVIGFDVPGFDDTEDGYCQSKNFALGSCYYTDHGVTSFSYRIAQNGLNWLSTAANEYRCTVFLRKATSTTSFSCPSGTGGN